MTSDGPQAAFVASTDSSRWTPTAPPSPDPWSRMQSRIEALPSGRDKTQALIDLNAMLTAYCDALRAAGERDPSEPSDYLP